MRRGLAAGIGGYVLWGFATFYWRLLGDVWAFEILVHRILWALPVLLVALALRRRLSDLRAVVPRDRLRLVASGAAVAVNWGLFIWAILIDRVVEASLAYYINPFLSVALGVLLFGEMLTRAQWVALGLAFGGVMTMVVVEGVVPWMALGMAATFATYGAVKKGTRSAGPIVALTWEVGAVYVVAVAAAGWMGVDRGSAFTAGASTAWLLAGAGVVTVVPLLLFGDAVRRIPLAWVGILQFITPTMFFLEGAFLFGEEVSSGRWIGFSLVWASVVLFIADVLGGRGVTAIPEPSHAPVGD